MTVALPRGGNVLLAKEAPGIERVRITLGWSATTRTTGTGAGAGAGTGTGPVPEADAVVVLVDTDEKAPRLLLTDQVPNPTERIGAPRAPHRTDGDTEQITVALPAVPTDVARLQFAAAIYDLTGRNQTFRAAPHGFIQVCDDRDGREIVSYTFEAETGVETALVFGELYRHPTGWKFRAVGEGYANGLPGLVGGSGGSADGIAAVHPASAAAFLTRLSPARSRRRVTDHLRSATRPAPPSPPATSPLSPPTPTPQRTHAIPR
ncbi:TerD family protein [Parafrankia sp. FMc2]|uniref:TerD family protein n=1 Tax=Parafrankia sp. FMc2 TaxID=3233196 RepID=UPI0034D398B9